MGQITSKLLGKRRRYISDPKILPHDLWANVCDKMDGKSLGRLCVVAKDFNEVLTDVGQCGIWRRTFFRQHNISLDDTEVNAPRPWKKIYASSMDGTHFYSFPQRTLYQPERSLDKTRLGVLYLKSSQVFLMSSLNLPNPMPLPGTDPQASLSTSNSCILSGFRRGVWIADYHSVQRGERNIDRVLIMRHAELFLNDEFKQGGLMFRCVGTRLMLFAERNNVSVSDLQFVQSQPTREVLNFRSWIGAHDDRSLKSKVCMHALGVNENRSEGSVWMTCRVMRLMNNEAVALKISFESKDQI